MSFNVDKYFDNLQNNDGLVLSYKGTITSGVINDILEKVEQKLEISEESTKVRKKIYNVLVEGLQNLYHHIEEQHDEILRKYNDKFGIFAIQRNEDGYTITLGNFVDKEQKDFLTEKIDQINLMSVEELKDLYKYILDHQKMSAKGGGGLGLVDIARKTNNKLEYEFFSFVDNWYFYKLNIFVSL